MEVRGFFFVAQVNHAKLWVGKPQILAAKKLDTWHLQQNDHAQLPKFFFAPNFGPLAVGIYYSTIKNQANEWTIHWVDLGFKVNVGI